MASNTSRSSINRANATLSTGPKSFAGKTTVRANALTHGAKAKNFINPNEEKQFEIFLKGLNQQYPSKNPIVRAQLERIAKIKVQLDRVQKIIDASFINSQDEGQLETRLMKILEMDSEEINTAEKIAKGELELPNTIRHNELRVAAELAHLDTSNFESTEDFLHHAPLMCRHLCNKADKQGVDIDTYITHHVTQGLNTSAIQEKLMNILIGDSFRNKNGDESLEDTYDKNSIDVKINRTKLENLKKAAHVLRQEINKIARLNHKIIAFNQLRQVEISPITIDYDNLDKLYRYQTTLQRQYSTVLGELLILTKAT